MLASVSLWRLQNHHTRALGATAREFTKMETISGILVPNHYLLATSAAAAAAVKRRSPKNVPLVTSSSCSASCRGSVAALLMACHGKRDEFPVGDCSAVGSARRVVARPRAPARILC